LLEDDKKIFSKNFTSWKVIANGPIRSIFELKYPSVNIKGVEALETKTISIDLGTNLYHANISYKSSKPLDAAIIGLALHKANGEIVSNAEEGWVSYWEPYVGSYVGTGILTTSESILMINNDKTLSDDETFNNIWVNTKIVNNSFDYWAGFGWRESGDFDNAEDWQNYLKQESIKKNNPLKVTITNNY